MPYYLRNQDMIWVALVYRVGKLWFMVHPLSGHAMPIAAKYILRKVKS